MAQVNTSLDSLRILLVGEPQEQSAPIEKALAEALPNTYQVQKASTIMAALRAITKNDFDVILLDLSLTEASQFSGLFSIQNMAPKLPVIVLTLFAQEELALKAVECGAQDYLFKDKINDHTIKRAIQYAIQRKNFEGVLITQANFDPLTHLANQILFESRLDMALARGKRTGAGVGVLFVDLDNFQLVNDTLGHLTGDHLLQQVAERLKQSVRPYDTAARLGGDEFALIIENIRQVPDCAVAAQRVISKIAEPFTLANKNSHIGISIGIATSLFGENLTREELMRHANEAMYNAKLNPQTNYVFYAPRNG